MRMNIEYFPFPSPEFPPFHSEVQPRLMTSATHTELPPLTDFVHKVFEEVFISSNDSVSESALYSYWSPNAEEKSVSYSLTIP
jgi:hypothetical protein